MLAARLMKSNMKLKMSSELDRASIGLSALSGMRQPFGSIRKKANASAGMSLKIAGRTGMKSCAGELAPFPAVKLPAPGLWAEASPLFEEESNLGAAALVAHFAHPVGMHGSGPRAAFAADNDPVDTCEIELADRSDQRLNGKK